MRTAPKPLLLQAYETAIFLFIILIGPILADIFLADLEEGVNSMLLTFLDDDEIGFCLPEGCRKITQRELLRSKRWAENNIMRFILEKMPDNASGGNVI